MIWNCPQITSYWVEITTAIGEITIRDNPCTPRHCLLHWFPHTAKTKTTSRFQDLALVLAKREITKNWKLNTGPKVSNWRREFIRWAECEGASLMREAKRKRGNEEMAREWETLVDDMKEQGEPDESIDQLNDPEGGVDSSPK